MVKNETMTSEVWFLHAKEISPFCSENSPINERRNDSVTCKNIAGIRGYVTNSPSTYLSDNLQHEAMTVRVKILKMNYVSVNCSLIPTHTHKVYVKFPRINIF